MRHSRIISLGASAPVLPSLSLSTPGTRNPTANSSKPSWKTHIPLSGGLILQEVKNRRGNHDTKNTNVDK
jgi:hypothetical protein